LFGDKVAAKALARRCNVPAGGLPQGPQMAEKT